MSMRWCDIVDPAPEETRSGDAVASDLAEKFGLTIVRGGETDGSI